MNTTGAMSTVNVMNASNYKTALGQAGKGRGVNTKPLSAFQYTFDIFKRAAEEMLDVYMLCGSLCTELRDDLYREVNGVPFASSIREVLERGRNVSIFIWDENGCEPSAECARLMEDAKVHPEWGTLEIWRSGTGDGGEKINHFIVAKSRDGTRWITRIEKPHPRLTLEQMRQADFEVPAALFFDSEEAKRYGKALLELFETLTVSVGNEVDHGQIACPA